MPVYVQREGGNHFESFFKGNWPITVYVNVAAGLGVRYQGSGIVIHGDI